MQPALALRRLRALVRRWPDVVETQSWGHPNWKRGPRQFASLDSYGGKPSICFKAVSQPMLVLRPHFFRAPYAASRGWVCRTLDEPLDWTELARLIRESYALVATSPKSTPKTKTKRAAPRARNRVRRG
jgi:predicted DNA-binding protein (MmcQ/YjbR family)